MWNILFTSQMEHIFESLPAMAADYIIAPALERLRDTWVSRRTMVSDYLASRHNCAFVCGRHNPVRGVIEIMIASAGFLMKLRLISPVMSLAMENNVYWKIVRGPFCSGMDRYGKHQQCSTYERCMVRKTLTALSLFRRLGEGAPLFLCFLRCNVLEEKKRLSHVCTDQRIIAYSGSTLTQLSRVADSYYDSIASIAKEYTKEGEDDAYEPPSYDIPPEDWFLLTATWDSICGLRRDIRDYASTLDKQAKLDATLEIIEAKKKSLWSLRDKKKRQEKTALAKRVREEGGEEASPPSITQKKQRVGNMERQPQTRSSPPAPSVLAPTRLH